MSVIEVEGLSKTFPDGTVAVDELSLRVEPGEVVSLLGPSGCGKTTTLRCIAGLETPDKGRITLDGRAVFEFDGQGPRLVVPPEGRGLSMVFQQYALWPHMTVYGNVAYGLEVRNRPRNEVEEATARALDRVQLGALRDRRISQLSGGQQQRVALARAIAFDPTLILFDEPLSNLDAKLREEMRLTLLELQRDLGFSALYVTHDQLEAISLSSRVAIMNGGQIEQLGSPREVWNAPRTSFVADFLGESNVWTARAASEGTGGRTVTIDEGLTFEVAGGDDVPDGAPVKIYVDINSIEVARGGSADTSQPNTFTGTVDLISFQGSSTLLKVAVGGTPIVAREAAGMPLAEGDAVTVRIDPSSVRCYHNENSTSD